MGTTNPPLNRGDIEEREMPVSHSPIAGDYKDDDATYTDEMLEPTLDAAYRDASTVTGLQADDKIDVPNTLITRRVTVANPASSGGLLPPSMLMPPQLKRKQISIQSECNLLIAGENNLLNGAGVFVAANQTFTLTGYTGAVWVQAASSVVPPADGSTYQASAWAVVDN